MKIGFTGTQEGMTDNQLKALKQIIFDDWCFSEFHHGGCIGADLQAHNNVKFICGGSVVLHPPINPYKQAVFPDTPGVDQARKPLDYMDRNQEIVNDSDILIAAPKEREEQQRSGTWATVRRARKKGIPVIILEP